MIVIVVVFFLYILTISCLGRKEEKEEPKFNIRPNFDKADWRDIEIFKYTREYERQQKGDKEVHWKEEEHYVPNRLAPRK